MREIKYRAWIESIGQMDEVVGLNFKKEIADFGNNNERPFYTLDLMQYTGLRDKNEKEIYEGDILSDGNDEKPYKVIFENGSFRAEFEGDFAEYSFDLINVVAQGCEVVGNIYENPELLGDKNDF